MIDEDYGFGGFLACAAWFFTVSPRSKQWWVILRTMTPWHSYYLGQLHAANIKLELEHSQSLSPIVCIKNSNTQGD